MASQLPPRSSPLWWRKESAIADKTTLMRADAPRIMHLKQFALGMMDEDVRSLPPILAAAGQ
jgi:hypothetical protein